MSNYVTRNSKILVVLENGLLSFSPYFFESVTRDFDRGSARVEVYKKP